MHNTSWSTWHQHLQIQCNHLNRASTGISMMLISKLCKIIFCICTNAVEQPTPKYQMVPVSVGNSHRSASPRPRTLEKDRELFVDFSSILCVWFEIQGLRTYNFFDWVSNTGPRPWTFSSLVLRHIYSNLLITSMCWMLCAIISCMAHVYSLQRLWARVKHRYGIFASFWN